MFSNCHLHSQQLPHQQQQQHILPMVLLIQKAWSFCITLPKTISIFIKPEIWFLPWLEIIRILRKVRKWLIHGKILFNIFMCCYFFQHKVEKHFIYLFFLNFRRCWNGVPWSQTNRILHEFFPTVDYVNWTSRSWRTSRYRKKLQSLQFWPKWWFLTLYFDYILGMPCFTSLVMHKVWDLAKTCPQPALDWLSIQVARNRYVQSWLISTMENWVEQYLLAHSNQKVRSSAAFLVVSLVNSSSFRQAFRTTRNVPSMSRESLLGN